MASSDAFFINVKGAGGHGAMPWMSKDPIVTAAQIVTNLQSMVSRQANFAEGAAVVTMGQFNAGNRVNIIPETASIAGTIRTLNEPTRALVHEAVTRMAQKTAEASGLTAEVPIDRGYPVLNNDAELTARMVGTLERAAGAGKVRETPPILASEDFGAFTDRRCCWFIERVAAPGHRRLAEPLSAVHGRREGDEDRREGTGPRDAGVHAHRAAPIVRILGIDPGLQTTGFGVDRLRRPAAGLRRQRHHQHARSGARRPAGAAEDAVRRHRRSRRALPAAMRGGRDRVRQRQPAKHAAAGPGARRRARGAGVAPPAGGRVHRVADEEGGRRPRQGRARRGAADGRAAARSCPGCRARTLPTRWASR